jgi:PAS domain S-box-containing protein/putative nucleotidyltransferase with HDIG domain
MNTPDTSLDADEIVIVDDTAASLNVLTEILTSAGYRVKPMSHGAVALHSIHANPPTLILLASRIADMDGFELCTRLKADKQTCDIPIIFLGLSADVDERIRCFESGGVDYIVKPFLSLDVLMRVKAHVSLFQSNAQLKRQNLQFSEANKRLAREVKTHQHYRTVFSEFLDGIALLSVDGGIIVDCNGAFEKICGYNAKQLKTMLIWELFPVEQAELREAFFCEVITTGYGYNKQLAIQRADESQCSVELIIKMIQLDAIDYLQLTVRDTSSQQTPPATTTTTNVAVSSVQSDSDSEQRLRQLFSSMEEGCFLAEPIFDGAGKTIDWRFLESNDAHAKTLGLKRGDEVVGKTLKEIQLTCEDFWFETATRTVLTGKASIIEGFSYSTNCHYEYRYHTPAHGQLACIFNDISARKRSVEKRENAQKKFHKVLEDSLQALIIALEIRDPYTAGHQKRVAKLAVAIAREMGIKDNRLQGIYFGGLLHDIGKIAVPAELLNRPGKLNELEYALVKQHPQTGFNIIKDIAFPWPVAQMILQHHEYIDGSGYPNGLVGDEILIEAKILMVADTIEAMYSSRPHRPSLGIDKALLELTQENAKRYDPKVVAACVSLFNDQDASALLETVDYNSQISKWTTSSRLK